MAIKRVIYAQVRWCEGRWAWDIKVLIFRPEGEGTISEARLPA